MSKGWDKCFVLQNKSFSFQFSPPFISLFFFLLHASPIPRRRPIGGTVAPRQRERGDAACFVNRSVVCLRPRGDGRARAHAHTKARQRQRATLVTAPPSARALQLGKGVILANVNCRNWCIKLCVAIILGIFLSIHNCHNYCFWGGVVRLY